MRFLKTLSLNRRAIYDDRLAIDTASGVIMNTPNNLLMPKGATGDRPGTPVTGMIRYNTSTNEVEVYQGVGGSATWRSLRFKESASITQQSLSVGDDIETIFGPLNPAPPSVVQSGTTWGGQNLIVVIENVIQLHTTNYVIVQDPVGRDPGYYLEFGSPVPLGKPVTVLHGFDQ
jgi:hypothetical protein